MNLLLDTNVIIDFMGRKKPFFANAERIIAAGYFGDVTLWTSVQSLKDAFFVLSHYIDSARVQAAILNLVEIVNPVDLTGDDVVRAARLQWNDLEDCLIAVSAAKANADFIITRDRKGFTRSMTPTRTPGEWLRETREMHGLTFDAVELD